MNDRLDKNEGDMRLPGVEADPGPGNGSADRALSGDEHGEAVPEENKEKLQAFIENVEGYLAVNPDWRNDAWFSRAHAYWKMGDKKPMAALACFNKGVGAASTADYVEAIYLFEKAAHLDPGFPWPANNLAWILSTCPDERLRDGRVAILYSQWALKMPKVEVADFVGTLAAAHAATGDFETAMRLCERAGEVWPTEETERMRLAFRLENVYVDRSGPPKKEDCISKEGCGKAKWGMSKLDVRAVFPKMVIEDNDTTTVRGCILKGREADLVLHFHQDRLYRAVVRVAGINAAEARGLAFRRMELEEAGLKSGNRREVCWVSDDTRARLQYDPQRMDAVIELESKAISAHRRTARAGMTRTLQ
jgi:tetratricopeptide (TPR) repeat protein